MRRSLAVFALAAAAALAACKRPHPGEVPVVRLGVDACARCGMIVSDDRFVSGYVDDRGESVVYDDVGELLEALAARPELKERSFVRDAADAHWLKASAAVFTRIEGLPTPMGSGYAAFADEAEASRFSRAGVKVE